jgi:hypothetical protein
MQTSRTLSADWTRVLARVETALAQAVVRLEAREQALTAKMPLPQMTTALDFAKFDERQGAFAACPGRAEQRLAQVDGALGSAEDALRQWLARAEGTRKKLADWVVRGGG